jgi:hypothetical protein
MALSLRVSEETGLTDIFGTKREQEAWKELHNEEFHICEI